MNPTYKDIEILGSFKSLGKIFTDTMELETIVPKDMRLAAESALLGTDDEDPEEKIYYADFQYLNDPERTIYILFPQAERGGIFQGGFTEWHDASSLDELEGIAGKAPPEEERPTVIESRATVNDRAELIGKHMITNCKELMDHLGGLRFVHVDKDDPVTMYMDEINRVFDYIDDSVHEFYQVTEKLKDALLRQEVMVVNIFGLWIWVRLSSGQAVYMDQEIRQVYQDLISQ